MANVLHSLTPPPDLELTIFNKPGVAGAVL